MANETRCEDCGTELGVPWRHTTARCRDVIRGQRDEVMRHLANCLDYLAALGQTSIAARAALEKLRRSAEGK